MHLFFPDGALEKGALWCLVVRMHRQEATFAPYLRDDGGCYVVLHSQKAVNNMISSIHSEGTDLAAVAIQIW